MRIERIEVQGFGRLEQVVLEPPAGLVILYGPNESGKTTLFDFIEAMLFGLPAGRRRLEADERRLYRPWSGTDYGGSLRFVSGGVRYELLRRFGERPGLDQVQLLRLPQREPVALGDQEPGGWLFGMDRAAFENAHYIPQMGSRVEADETLRRRLAALAGGSEAALSAGELLARLEAERGRLRARRGGGGRIGELERALAAERAALEGLRQAAREAEASRLEEAAIAARLAADEAAWAGRDGREREREAERARLVRELGAAELEAAVDASSGRRVVRRPLWWLVAALLLGGGAVLGAAWAWRLGELLAAVLLLGLAGLGLLVLGFAGRRVGGGAGDGGAVSGGSGDRAAGNAGSGESRVRELRARLRELDRDLPDARPREEREADIARLNQLVALRGRLEDSEDSPPLRQAAIAELESELALALEAVEEIDFAKRIVQEVAGELGSRVAPRLHEMAQAMLARIEGREGGDSLIIDQGLGLHVRDAVSGFQREVAYYSGGRVDQLYLALRLALIACVYDDGEPLPLLLDDVCAQYDEERTAATLDLLADLARQDGNGRQIFYASCHARVATWARANGAVVADFAALI
ncbi:MAG: AAA family ATPase [Bacillota bacterium]|nr:AAA family ATPase [Bacillota bacterium]